MHLEPISETSGNAFFSYGAYPLCSMANYEWLSRFVVSSVPYPHELWMDPINPHLSNSEVLYMQGTVLLCRSTKIVKWAALEGA